MITTINISLPKKLKEAADALVAGGDYASFSDLARSAIRDIVLERKYRALIEESKREEKLGLIKPLRGPKEIEDFVNNLGK